jgi:Holliday junction resolvase RusA-like endonuclease
MLLDIVIPALPPNTNHAYGIHRSRMYKTKAAQDYQEFVSYAVLGLAIPARTPLGVSFAFTMLAGDINRSDLDGRIKLLLDAIFQQGKGNDAWVRVLNCSKSVGMEEQVRVKLWIIS